MVEGEERLRDGVKSAAGEQGTAAAMAYARATSFVEDLLRNEGEMGRELRWLWKEIEYW